MPTLKLTHEQQAALKELRVRAYDQDLRTFTAKQLRAEFSTQKTKRVLSKVLVRNVVFQAASWAIEGKAPKINGNLRSLYYQWVKPVVAKLPELLKTKVDYYDETLNALELFIGELRLFAYRDLELVDERWENGFVQFLQEASRTYGITTVALGGSPSHLSTEYLAAQLKKLKFIEPLVLFGICDFDPAGADIAKAFVQQLSRQGLQVKEQHSLITPKVFGPDELLTLRFSVPQKLKGLVTRWLKAGGGLGGKAFGIEADALPKPRLVELVAQRLAPYLRNKPIPLLREKETKA
jgi:hypothetical protein